MSRLQLPALYALFAAIATATNLGAQWLVLLIGPDRWVELLALAVGTVAGMPVKYVLDKRWIFRFQTDGLAHDARLFALYSGMAVVTTVLFWATELLVGAATDSRAGLLAGGALGLCVGYALKYQLDKRYVFVKAAG